MGIIVTRAGLKLNNVSKKGTSLMLNSWICPNIPIKFNISIIICVINPRVNFVWFILTVISRQYKLHGMLSLGGYIPFNLQLF